MIDEELKRLRELAVAAGEGPWGYADLSTARAALPALLNEVERMRAVLNRWEVTVGTESKMLWPPDAPRHVSTKTAPLLAFVAAERKDERERCARVAESVDSKWNTQRVAAAIRALPED